MLLTTEKVWEEFNTGLKQFILKRVPDEASAEDVLQEVFLKIHTRIDTLRDKERLPGWIYTIARNAIYDYYREQKTAVPDMSPELPEDPFDNVVVELAPAIRRMVESLPDEYREALVLTEYEGLSQRELAERLGLSYSGAKSRVQRAREKIKQMLLDCCHLEFDRTGHVINYQPRCSCCRAIGQNDGQEMGCGAGCSSTCSSSHDV
jgi:RNA polymerase sigma-70 factor (ECF subfamily)